MEGSIRLSAADRKVLVLACQRGPSVQVSRRAQVLLLAAAGWSWREIRSIAFVSYDLIRQTLTRWRRDGVKAVIEVADPSTATPPWLKHVVEWLTSRTPRDFGYFRSRWSCAALAETLAWETGVRTSGETLRRALRKIGWVWRRPRPVVGLSDPEYAEKVQRIQNLLSGLPAQETAVFQDEVDVHLNPKIGSC